MIIKNGFYPMGGGSPPGGVAWIQVAADDGRGDAATRLDGGTINATDGAIYTSYNYNKAVSAMSIFSPVRKNKFDGTWYFEQIGSPPTDYSPLIIPSPANNQKQKVRFTFNPINAVPHGDPFVINCALRLTDWSNYIVFQYNGTKWQAMVKSTGSVYNTIQELVYAAPNYGDYFEFSVTGPDATPTVEIKVNGASILSTTSSFPVADSSAGSYFGPMPYVYVTHYTDVRWYTA